MTFVPHEKKPLLARILEWLNEPEEWPAWVQFFLLPKPLGRNNFFAARVVLLFAMAFFALQAFAGVYESWIAQFLHNLNLPVHETGHIVFRIFGSEVITSLGGRPHRFWHFRETRAHIAWWLAFPDDYAARVLLCSVD